MLELEHGVPHREKESPIYISAVAGEGAAGEAHGRVPQQEVHRDFRSETVQHALKGLDQEGVHFAE